MATPVQGPRVLLQRCIWCRAAGKSASSPVRSFSATTIHNKKDPDVPRVKETQLLNRQAWRDRISKRSGVDEQTAERFNDFLFQKFERPATRSERKAIRESEIEDDQELDSEVRAMGIRPGDEYDDDDDERGSGGKKKTRMRKTLLNLGSEVDMEVDNPEDEYDDITTTGHYNLEHMREIRHYARLTAWEMPLLAQLAQEFEPPSMETPLRFRYTTYMGEAHPAERKVVMEFCPHDITDLTPVQKQKLIKLAGARYNPETRIIKMSSESFETQVKNKRYLGDLLEKLVNEAKDDTDTFQDVPYDFRHHKFNTTKKFPRHWNLTKERMNDLQEYRRQIRATNEEATAAEGLIDGAQVLKEALISEPKPQQTQSPMDFAMATLPSRPRHATR